MGATRGSVHPGRFPTHSRVGAPPKLSPAQPWKRPDLYHPSLNPANPKPWAARPGSSPSTPASESDEIERRSPSPSVLGLCVLVPSGGEGRGGHRHWKI